MAQKLLTFSTLGRWVGCLWLSTLPFSLGVKAANGFEDCSTPCDLRPILPRPNNWVSPTPLLPADGQRTAQAVPAQTSPKPLFVGVYLNREEVDSLDILDTGKGYLLPFEALMTLLKVEHQTQPDQSVMVTTPLGVATFQSTELQSIHGVIYIQDRTFSDRLAIPTRFSSQDFALFLEVPWPLDAMAVPKATLKPDVRPPQNGFSNLRSATGFGLSNTGADLSNSLQVGGQLAGGAWQVQLDHTDVLDTKGGWRRPRFSQYFYQNQIGPVHYRTGKQQIQLHPLLSSLDLTGAQVAYSNQPDLFDNYGLGNTFSTSAGLLSRRSQPLKAFRGNAPPASIVQLRVDGLLIEQQQTRLNGQYEFLNVPLGLGDDRQIEILIFDRRNLRVPLETRQIRLNATDLLLPQATVSHLAGLGLSGNVLDQAISKIRTTSAGQPVAFYQWRQGLTDDLTLEAALQKTPEATQAQAGMVWRFASPWVLELAAGLNDRGSLAYQFNLFGSYPRWRARLNSEYMAPEFTPQFTFDDRVRFNHSLEFSYDLSRNLTLGAIARTRQDSEGQHRYILPTFAWRPHPNLSLRGRPDSQGEYYYDAYYRPSRRTELTLSGTTRSGTLDFGYDLNNQYRFNIGADLDRTLAPRYFAIITRGSRFPRDPSLSLGVSVREGELGLIASGSLELFPGVLATLQYQSQTRASGSDFNTQNLQLLISTDFSLQKGRLRPANSGLLTQGQGAITGRLVAEKGSTAPRESLEGALVTATPVTAQRRLQLNQISARTDRMGNFYFSGLPAGLYVIKLTPENLPIQYTPTKTRLIAEVRGGTITQADFNLVAEYGLAGRIVDAHQKPVAGITVELLDAQGKPIATALSDEFGLYRIDRLRTGRYILRIADPRPSQTVNPSPQRTVEIQHDFLFGQDLQLPSREP